METWTTATGQVMLLTDMDYTHLVNSRNLLRRKLVEMAEQSGSYFMSESEIILAEKEKIRKIIALDDEIKRRDNPLVQSLQRQETYRQRVATFSY